MDNCIVHGEYAQLFIMRKTKYFNSWVPNDIINAVINVLESKRHDPMIPSNLFKDFESKPIAFNWRAIL